MIHIFCLTGHKNQAKQITCLVQYLIETFRAPRLMHLLRPTRDHEDGHTNDNQEMVMITQLASVLQDEVHNIRPDDDAASLRVAARTCDHHR